MKPIIPKDNPPADRLSSDTRIESIDDLKMALGEIAWIDGRSRTVQAASDQVIALHKREVEKQMQIDVDGTAVPFAQRRLELCELAETFCRAHPEIFEGDAKSRTFTEGTVSFKASREAIGFQQGHDARRVVKRIDEATDLTQQINAWIAEAGIEFLDLPISTFVNVSLTLSKSEVLKAYKADELTKADLRSAGLKLVGGEDVFFAKPCEDLVRTESDKNAA